MKKIVLSLFSLGCILANANAQTKNEGFHFGAGIKAALPVGNFDSYSVGVGAELQGEYHFIEKLSGVVSAGYTYYAGKTGYEGINIIPVLAGIRFYPANSFFIGAKAGVAFSTASGGGSAFNYLPQVGYNANHFQVALGYDAWTKNSYTLGSIAASGIYKF